MAALRSVRFWWWVTLIVLVVSLIPMAWISLDTHIVADDYASSVETHQAWVQTHNPLAVLGAAAQFAATYYQEWQGSYAANFLFALHPGIWGEPLYFLTTFVMLGVFLLCNAYFFRKIFRDALHVAEPKLAGVVSNLTAFFSIQLAVLPSDAFFWWNGSAYYVIFYSLMLPLLANAIVSLAQNRCGGTRLAGMLVLAVCVAGGNLVTGLVAAELLALGFLVSLLRRRKVSVALGLVLLVYLGGFFLNVNAPGTHVRLATRLEMLTVPETVLKAFLEAIRYGAQWTDPILTVGLLFMTPFLAMIPAESLPKAKLPLFGVLFALFAVFASTFAPTAYVYYKDVGRIQNVRLFLWILLLLSADLTLIQYARTLLQAHGVTPQRLSAVGRSIYAAKAPAYFLCLLVCEIGLLGYHVGTDHTNVFTSTSCLRSLVKGEAQRYHEVMLKREALLLGEDRVVTLPWLDSFPDALYISDFLSDPHGWVNEAAAAYYQKDEVRMQ